jgi:hypothetical protein
MIRLKKRKDGRYQRNLTLKDSSGNSIKDEHGKSIRVTAYGFTIPELQRNEELIYKKAMEKHAPTPKLKWATPTTQKSKP